MTKTELIENVQKRNPELTKADVGRVVDDVFAGITTAVKKEGKFTLTGFGTWTMRARKARKGRNPQTGEIIKIKSSKTVAFKPSSVLKGKM